MRLRRQPTLKTALLMFAVASLFAAGAAGTWRSLIEKNSEGVGYYALLTLLPSAFVRLGIALVVALKTRSFAVATAIWVLANVLAGFLATAVLGPTASALAIVVGVSSVDSLFILPAIWLTTGDQPFAIFVGQIVCGMAWGAFVRLLAATCRETWSEPAV